MIPSCPHLIHGENKTERSSNFHKITQQAEEEIQQACKKPWLKECGLSEGMGDTRRTWPTESTKQGPYGLTETKSTSTGPASVCSRASVYMLWVLAWFFSGTPESGSRYIPDFFVCPWDSFSPIAVPCPALCESFCFVLLYHALPCLTGVCWRPAPF